ncbi:MAG: winged helix-turn-helix transcriptional regulator [Chloroflexi bacterium]|nr:winged helix-turn-helix transcriptional regulator [Chloroflexota bacterium]
MDTISTYRAIADPTRRVILDILMQDGPLRAGDLAGRIPEISRPAVSKHMRVLRNSALVVQVSQGRERWYHLDAKPLNDVYSWLEHYETFWKDKLENLKQIVETKE